MFKKKRKFIDPNSVAEVKNYLAEIEPPLGAFEKQVFIPELTGRVLHLENRFNEIINISNRPRMAERMDHYLRKTIELSHPQGDPELANIGENYLSEVRRIVNEDFRPYIDELKAFNIEVLKSDKQHLLIFLNKLNFTFEVITATRDVLLKYSVKTRIHVRDTNGTTVNIDAKSYMLILEPFDLVLNELTTSARTGAESIRKWVEDLSAQRKKHPELIKGLIDHKIASSATEGAYITLVIQILLAVIAVASVFAIYRAEMYIENSDLQELSKSLRKDKDLLRAEIAQKDSEIKLLGEQLRTTKAELEKAKNGK